MSSPLVCFRLGLVTITRRDGKLGIIFEMISLKTNGRAEGVGRVMDRQFL